MDVREYQDAPWLAAFIVVVDDDDVAVAASAFLLIMADFKVLRMIIAFSRYPIVIWKAEPREIN